MGGGGEARIRAEERGGGRGGVGVVSEGRMRAEQGGGVAVPSEGRLRAEWGGSGEGGGGTSSLGRSQGTSIAQHLSQSPAPRLPPPPAPHVVPRCRLLSPPSPYSHSFHPPPPGGRISRQRTLSPRRPTPSRALARSWGRATPSPPAPGQGLAQVGLQAGFSQETLGS